MREETWQEIVAADAILFGAIGSPEYEKIPREARKVDQLPRMRREPICSPICGRCTPSSRWPTPRRCVPR